MAVNQTAQANISVPDPQRSVFHPASTEGDGLDWLMIYTTVGIASSGASEAVNSLLFARDSHPRVAADERIVEALAQAKALRSLLQDMSANAYARWIEQRVREGRP